MGIGCVNLLYEEYFIGSHACFFHVAVHQHGGRDLLKWDSATGEKAGEKVTWRSNQPGTFFLAPKWPFYNWGDTHWLYTSGAAALVLCLFHSGVWGVQYAFSFFFANLPDRHSTSTPFPHVIPSSSPLAGLHGEGAYSLRPAWGSRAKKEAVTPDSNNMHASIW